MYSLQNKCSHNNDNNVLTFSYTPNPQFSAADKRLCHSRKFWRYLYYGSIFQVFGIFERDKLLVWFREYFHPVYSGLIIVVNIQVLFGFILWISKKCKIGVWSRLFILVF